MLSIEQLRKNDFRQVRPSNEAILEFKDLFRKLTDFVPFKRSLLAALRSGEITKDKFLVCAGINKSDPRRFNFIFQDKASRIKILDDFFAGRAVVEPRQFVAVIKELKSLVYSDALQP